MSTNGSSFAAISSRSVAPDQIDAGARTEAKEAAGCAANLWPHRSQGRDKVADEPGEIVVGNVEREPGVRERP
jgi:hypothetical protein